jgi:hypothetical protein
MLKCKHPRRTNWLHESRQITSMNPRAFADIVEVIQLPNCFLRFVRDNGQKLG